MNENMRDLLPQDHFHIDNDEEELLWNALNDNHHQTRELSTRSDISQVHTPDISSKELPSLRSHIHLPAISSICRDVITSTKIAWAKQPNPWRSGNNRAPSSTNARDTRRKSTSMNVPDGQGRVDHLDGFLISLYNYYYQKGFWSIVTVEFVSLMTGFFSVSLSSFLLGCVEWKHLIHCSSRMSESEECQQDLEHYVSCKAGMNPSFYHLVVAFYFCTFLVYCFFRSMQLARTLRETREMGKFYHERLHIDERQVQTITWDEVVGRVLDLLGANVPNNVKQISSYRLQIDSSLLSNPHDFARRIMRRENYLTACMNHQSSFFRGLNILHPRLQFASITQVMFSRNMECNLNICLVDYMFDTSNKLSDSFLSNVHTLQKRFVVAGIINLVLTPFILIYRIFHFFFVSAQEWHTNRTHYFGTRRWSSYALWKFREYNELPHVLDARVARSYPLAEKYLALFPPGAFAIVAGGIAFCASSLMAVLLAVSLLEESILLETTLYGRQLLWYLTVATALFALSRSFTGTQSPFSLEGNCEEAMLQLSGATHYFPKEWRGQCHTFETRDEFASLFPYKAILFAQECLSVLMAPYILCVSLPNCAQELLSFLSSHTLTLPHVGSVCRFGEFDFKQYGNDRKMQSSFVNFKQNHPKWTGGEQGESLMQRLGQLKEEEMEKSIRMTDTFYESQFLTASQQLLQSQAIHCALSKPQDNEFYWLEKLQLQLAGPSCHDDQEELRQNEESDDEAV